MYGQPKLLRAVDHKGELIESFVTKRRDKRAALKFLKKAMRHGLAEEVMTDRLPSYRAAMRVVGWAEKQRTGRWDNNRIAHSYLPFRRRERVLHYRMFCAGAGDTCRQICRYPKERESRKSRGAPGLPPPSPFPCILLT